MSRPSFNSSTRFDRAASANPPRRSRTPTPRRTDVGREQSAPPPAAPIERMLQDIVSITQNVALTLRSTPRSHAPPNSTPGLNREDIERIVRRTEQHFLGQLEQYKSRCAELETLLRQSTARDEKPSGSTCTSCNELRAQLHAEKHHRLECEEQSQKMNEEHSKLVANLELRIKKLERQAQDTGNLSVRGTPRANRQSIKCDDDHLDQEIRPAAAPRPSSPPSIQLSTSAVNDFLSSIGRELDAINAMEASRGRHLSAL